MLKDSWSSVALGQVVTLQRGFDLPSRLRRPGSVPIVTSSGVAETHNAAQVKGPGVVTGRYGTIGEVFFIPADFWPHNTTLYVKDFKGSDPLFISYLLKTIDFASHSGKSGVPGVNRNDLHQLRVQVPPRPEQRAIAAALSDVDGLISALDKLIAEKRDIKQATMQQLLTGKTRLPGLRAAWELKQIRSIAPLQRGFDLPTNQISSGAYPVVYSNGVLNYHSAYTVKGPGVITGRSGTIGNVFFVGQNFWPHNTSLWVTSFCGNDPYFIYYLYSHIGFERFSTGSGVPTLNRNDVHSYRVLFPNDPQEQRAIAAVLSDMDAEIAALQRRRDKSKAIKQGMMQALLTGRVRLVKRAAGA